MPSSYVKQSGAAVPGHFRQLLRLLDRHDYMQSALLNTYVQELGEPDWRDYSLDQLRQDVEAEPILYFMLVSLFLGDPPPMLNFTDRMGIADSLRIAISDFERLSVTDNGVWLRELVHDPPDDTVGAQPLRIARYEYRLNSRAGTDEIVPFAVFDYLKSSVVCYRTRIYTAALALAAIAFEACLREVLRGRHRDVITLPPPYRPAKAQVDAYLFKERPTLVFKVKGACQDLQQYFQERGCNNKRFLGNIKFDITRDELLSSEGQSRVPLRLEADRQYVDLLSSDQLETTHRQRNADKFSEFNEAAERAGRLQARRLPLASAEVIRQVRNYLVHWDESCLEEELRNGQTVREYIADTDTVRSTIEDVVSFISNEYYELRLFELESIMVPT